MAKLFIGGLAWHTDDRTLYEEFSRHGQVVEATVIRDRDTDRSRGFGFVTFETQDQADAARQSLDDTDFDGRRIRVSQAADRRGGGGRGGGRGVPSGGFGGGRGGFYAPPGGTWRDTREPTTQSYQQSSDPYGAQEQGFHESAGYTYNQPPQPGRYTEAGEQGQDPGSANTASANRDFRDPRGVAGDQRYDQRNGYGQGFDGSGPSQ